MALRAAFAFGLIAFNVLAHEAAFAAESGISGLVPARVFRRLAAGAPAGKTWIYQLASPLQVSHTRAAIFANIREAEAQGVDFEAGNDVIVFGSLAEIATAEPRPLNRNHSETNPNTTPPGMAATMVKYPVRGGFVPLGARLSESGPHPAAGTGFGLSLAQAWKVLPDGPPPYEQNSYTGAESHTYWEFQQYAFDGSVFQVKGTRRARLDELVAGWIVSNGGLTNAIPEGADLLVAMLGKKPKIDATGVRPSGSGILRMRWERGEWRAHSFTLVPGTSGLFEPSLIRDTDGALLFTGRGGAAPEHRNAIRIWRSPDGGQSWALVIDAKGRVSPAPISINQAADGTPFIASNVQSAAAAPVVGQRPIEPGKNTRSTLVLWPLNRERTALAAPITVLDCRAEFGPPVAGSNWTWRADHPSAATVRLTDGKWHTLLGFRVQDYREIKKAMPPTPQTGMYVQEVLSSGVVVSGWRFDRR